MLLIIGYGNPLRGDDGAGPAVIDALESTPTAQRATLMQRHQLGPELAEDLARCEAAIFVDARADGTPGEVDVRELVAASGEAAAQLTHHMPPPLLLALARELYGHAPRALLVTICGQSFGAGEPLSALARAAVQNCSERVQQLATELMHS